MKKLLLILLCVVIVASAFVACSKADNNETTQSTVSQITTDSAKVKDSDAINLIKSYSAKELSLNDEDYKNVSFMVSNSGYEFDGANYIKVIATIKIAREEDGKTYYNFDNKGEYLISYDGKTILQRDMAAEQETYSEMEVKPVPTTEAPTTHAAEESTKK